MHYLIIRHVEVDSVWWKMKRKTRECEVCTDNIHLVVVQLVLADVDGLVRHLAVTQGRTGGRGFLQ